MNVERKKSRKKIEWYTNEKPTLVMLFSANVLKIKMSCVRNNLVWYLVGSSGVVTGTCSDSYKIIQIHSYIQRNSSTYIRMYTCICIYVYIQCEYNIWHSCSFFGLVSLCLVLVWQTTGNEEKTQRLVEIFPSSFIKYINTLTH